MLDSLEKFENLIGRCQINALKYNTKSISIEVIFYTLLQTKSINVVFSKLGFNILELEKDTQKLFKIEKESFNLEDIQASEDLSLITQRAILKLQSYSFKELKEKDILLSLLTVENSSIMILLSQKGINRVDVENMFDLLEY